MNRRRFAQLAVAGFLAGCGLPPAPPVSTPDETTTAADHVIVTQTNGTRDGDFTKFIGKVKNDYSKPMTIKFKWWAERDGVLVWVESRYVTSGPLPPGQSEPFSVTVPTPGVWDFDDVRFNPIVSIVD